MLTWIGRSLIALSLLAQEPGIDLDRDYQRLREGSRLAMVTIVARHEDGAPVRGYIRCSGYWFKHADEEEPALAWALPFKTDARGAIIMNPAIEDEWIVCYSEDKGKSGKVMVGFSDAEPTQVVEIILK